jgi:dihydroorotate dehydrogenase (NAD+) catalytic subunit
MTRGKADLSVEIGQIKLKNPVIAAAGTFPEMTAEKLLGRGAVKRLGAIVTKTVTLTRRGGNPQPRIAETSCGVVNSIGLENEGIEEFISIRLPKVLSYRVPVIVSIAGFSVREFGELARRIDALKPARRLAGAGGVAALEVNISCPNAEGGGAHFGLDRNASTEVVSEVKSSANLPVFVKLPPATHIREIAVSVETAGADAVVVANTLPAVAFLNRREGEYLTGGLSGPAIKPHIMHLVREVADCVRIPVIACGGIRNGEDALEYLACGAAAVEVGTATLIEPKAILRIIEEIEQILKYEKKSMKYKV